MTIMEEPKADKIDKPEVVKETASKTDAVDDKAVKQDPETEVKDNDPFSEENLVEDTEVKSQDKPGMVITAEDKIAFVDSVVGNTRFTRDYSLFGGKMTLTVRSLTVDETNALGAWTAKIGSNDPAGLMAGRYRKYLAAAQIARFNGVDMSPLEEPLFATLGKDGKTVSEPAWLDRSAYWDSMGAGVFQAVMSCIADFDARYATLCKEAENANFWAPDTP